MFPIKYKKKSSSLHCAYRKKIKVGFCSLLTTNILDGLHIVIWADLKYEVSRELCICGVPLHWLKTQRWISFTRHKKLNTVPILFCGESLSVCQQCGLCNCGTEFCPDSSCWKQPHNCPIEVTMVLCQLSSACDSELFNKFNSPFLTGVHALSVHTRCITWYSSVDPARHILLYIYITC